MMGARIARLLAIAVLLSGCSLASPQAPLARAGDLVIEQAWVRTPAAGLDTSAAYMTIRNAGDEPDQLVAVTSPAIATIEIHTGTQIGDVAHMQLAPSGIAIPAGTTVDMQASGAHLMLIGIRAGLAPGASLPLTLHFTRAGQVEIDAPVRR
jgi:copper(I)-binding protein